MLIPNELPLRRRKLFSLTVILGLASACQTDKIRSAVSDDGTCQVCSHSHDAADIVSGKLELGRIPMGPGSNLNADLVDGFHAEAFRKQNEKIPWADIDGAPSFGLQDGKYIENRSWLDPAQSANIHVAGSIVARDTLSTYADAYVGAQFSTATASGGWGKALYFRGAPDVSEFHDNSNSDDLYIARYNVASDVTELRVSIGNNATDHSSLVDKFVVGAHDWTATGYPWLARFSVDSTGKVQASGSFISNGTPDLAETIAAAPNVEPGDVVCADPRKNESVRKCGDGGALRPLGVISDGTSAFMISAYAESLDSKWAGKPLVLAGRVPVKISLEGGPIEIGDELAPASRPGFAKKATKAGVVVGIALASARHENSKVLTLVKVGAGVDAIVAENAELKARMSRMEASMASLQKWMESQKP